jgi:hypothetical protein
LESVENEFGHRLRDEKKSQKQTKKNKQPKNPTSIIIINLKRNNEQTYQMLVSEEQVRVVIAQKHWDLPSGQQGHEERLKRRLNIRNVTGT